MWGARRSSSPGETNVKAHDMAAVFLEREEKQVAKEEATRPAVHDDVMLVLLKRRFQREVG